MVKFDEDTVITGSEDGQIRAVSVLPNKIIAVLGDPLDQGEGSYHIQRITVSHDRSLLASCSLDDIVKIIDISNIGDRYKDEFDEDQYEEDLKANPKVVRKAKKAKKTNVDGDEEMGEEKKSDNSSENAGDWESGSSDDDSDSDDSSDMDSEKPEKKDKKLNLKGNNVVRSAKMQDDDRRKQFFSDL